LKKISGVLFRKKAGTQNQDYKVLEFLFQEKLELKTWNRKFSTSCSKKSWNTNPGTENFQNPVPGKAGTQNLEQEIFKIMFQEMLEHKSWNKIPLRFFFEVHRNRIRSCDRIFLSCFY